MPVKELGAGRNLIRIQGDGDTVLISGNIPGVLHVFVDLFQGELFGSHVPGQNGVGKMLNICRSKDFSFCTGGFLSSAALFFSAVGISGFAAVLKKGEQGVGCHTALPVAGQILVKVGNLNAAALTDFLKHPASFMEVIYGRFLNDDFRDEGPDFIPASYRRSAWIGASAGERIHGNGVLPGE